MSKFIQIGLTAVAIADLRVLTAQEKFSILGHMFDASAFEKDNHEQIILHTGMGPDDDGNIIPIAPSEVDDTPDPYEEEEEEEKLPDTLRNPLSIAS